MIVVSSSLREKGGCREAVPIFADSKGTGEKGYLTVEENINSLKEYIHLKRIYTSKKICTSVKNNEQRLLSHMGMCC